MNRNLINICVLVCSLSALQSCAYVKNIVGTKYGEAGSVGGLEAPPELVTPEWDESLKIPQTANDRVSAIETYGKALDASVAPEYVDVSLRREGDLRWLEAEVDPVNVWPLLRSFWANQGIGLDKDLPSTGIMETDWIEQIDSSNSGITGGREVAASRSKFRIRLEREPNAVTNIFISQRKADLQAITDQGGVWAAAKSDPEAEAEVMVNLMEHMGKSRQDALFEVANAQGPRLYIDLKDVDGIPVLFVGDQYSRVWRRTGIALDRTGLTIFEQSRTKGVYFIDTSNLDLPDGTSLQSSRYQVHLLPQSAQTLITVHFADDAEGRVVSEYDARLILNQILSAYQVFRTTG
ncbi:MAG: outer membrane protein assembly factor BamC [Gammaproteobacteria bacterium]|nr:outer membrane protein assembly factor BamC [Gammaproteobacteria bacterium]